MTTQRTIKLNDKETARFLELYEMERILYDPNLENYRDRDLRDGAAKRISDTLKISGFGPKEVITKFKNLRSSYCQELKKIADSERSGSGTDDIYKPKVVWFEQMNRFIRPFVQQRPITSNLVSNKSLYRIVLFSFQISIYFNTTIIITIVTIKYYIAI